MDELEEKRTTHIDELVDLG